MKGSSPSAGGSGSALLKCSGPVDRVKDSFMSCIYLKLQHIYQDQISNVKIKTCFESTADTDLNIGPLSVHQLTDDLTQFISIGELTRGEENRKGCDGTGHTG